MKRGRITEEEEILPKWNGLRHIPLTEWVENGLYQKAYFKSSVPSITCTVPTQVSIREDGARFAYIIQMNDELLEFVEFVNRNIFFSPFTYKLDDPYEIRLSVYDGKFYIKTFTRPIIFDENKIQIQPELPLAIKAKVKISAASISRKKDDCIYHVFFKVDQMLMDNTNVCLWK